MSLKINNLAMKSGQIGPKGNQPHLPLVVEKEREIDGVLWAFFQMGRRTSISAV